MERITIIFSFMTVLVGFLGGFRWALNEWRLWRSQVKRTGRWLLFLVLVQTVPAHAQLWSGVLDPTRATDWSGAGVTGGIPPRTTICNTLSAGVTAAQIDTALSGCTVGQTVKLNAGTYNLAAGINLRAGVTLRGSGPNSTFLIFSNDTSCTGQFTLVCATSSNLSYYAPGPPSNVVNWTAGFSQGTTTITLASVPGLSIGMYLLVDGESNGINADDIVNCDTITTCTTEAGGGVSANQRNTTPHRAQREMFKVTNIAGNNVTLDHGLRFPNWAVVPNPQAWWGNASGMATGFGLEDLSIERTFDVNYSNITFAFVAESWIKNVRSVNAPAPRANVLLYEVSHIEIRDSYWYGSMDESSGPTHYGIEAFPAYDSKVENNIFQRRTSPIVLDGAVGNVIAYNFCVYDTYLVSPTFLQGCYYSHEGGNGYNLFEGNIGPQFKADVVHASSSHGTSFRGYYPGWEPGKTSETGAVKIYALQRFYNLIGNVLGRTGYHTTYSSSTNDALAVISVGHGGPVTDTYALTSLMRWGNYDTVNASTRFVNAEVPDSLTKYANPIPASQTLPNSFYLSAQPSAWWGVIGQSAIPFPPIGPDVTGQTVQGTSGSATWVTQSVGGHVAPIPALVCYKEIMGGPADGIGAVLAFDANTCYTSGGTPPSSTIPTAIAMGKRALYYVELVVPVIGLGWHFRRAILASVLLIASGTSITYLGLRDISLFACGKVTASARSQVDRIALAYLNRKGPQG